MTRVWRSTVFTRTSPTPMTTIVLEDDLKSERIEAAQAELAEHMDAAAFIIDDIFEIGDTDDPYITGTQRAAERQMEERNMALLYFYYAEKLTITEGDGMLTSTLPAPLNGEQIEYALARLANHPNYQRQTVISHDRDMTPVKLTPEGISHGE